jgi:hypothetical protein
VPRGQPVDEVHDHARTGFHRPRPPNPPRAPPGAAGPAAATRPALDTDGHARVEVGVRLEQSEPPIVVWSVGHDDGVGVRGQRARSTGQDRAARARPACPPEQAMTRRPAASASVPACQRPPGTRTSTPAGHCGRLRHARGRDRVRPAVPTRSRSVVQSLGPIRASPETAGASAWAVGSQGRRPRGSGHLGPPPPRPGRRAETGRPCRPPALDR